MPNDIANNMADTINQLDEQIKELESKHWDECRQIAHYDDELKEAKRLLKAAVDVQPANQWTSVHDSLPPDNKPCVVVTKGNGLGVSRLMGRNKLEWTLFGKPVLYWIPCPEPPKDGDTD